eukprot:4878150-Prymnesium_polylepis.1
MRARRRGVDAGQGRRQHRRGGQQQRRAPAELLEEEPLVGLPCHQRVNVHVRGLVAELDQPIPDRVIEERIRVVHKRLVVVVTLGERDQPRRAGQRHPLE